MPRKLYDIDVEEITLCESAANRKQFFIKKSKEINVDKFIEVLKSFVVDEDDDEFTSEEIAKAEALEKESKATLENALNTFAEYKESMPDELLAAAKIIVREASFGHELKKEELEKAGAKLSKTTKANIAKALALLKPPAAVLKTMLGQDVEKEEEEEEEKSKKEVLSEETQAKLKKLTDFEKTKAEADKAEAEKKSKQATLDLINEQLEERGIKEVPAKKSIDEPGDDDDGEKEKVKKDDENKDNWPSLYIPGISDAE